MLISVDFAYLAELDGVIANQLKRIDMLIPSLKDLLEEVTLMSPAEAYSASSALRDANDLREHLVRKRKYLEEVDEELHAYFRREERIVEETRGLARRLEV